MTEYNPTDAPVDEYDPSKETVDQVNEHLATLGTAERERVLAAEAAGKARKGILEPYADPEADATHPLQPTTTKGVTFQEAAEAATPAPAGKPHGLTLADVVAGPAPDNRRGLPVHDDPAADDREN